MDQRLVTECLTVLYKLNPWGTLRQIVPIVLDPGMAAVYRSVLAKMCFSIVSEENQLPWNPTMDAYLAVSLRSLFLVCQKTFVFLLTCVQYLSRFFVYLGKLEPRAASGSKGQEASVWTWC